MIEFSIMTAKLLHISASFQQLCRGKIIVEHHSNGNSIRKLFMLENFLSQLSHYIWLKWVKMELKMTETQI